MSLAAPGTVVVGEPFTLTINAAPAPDVEIAGFATEVVFPDGLKWLQRPQCLGPGPSGEVQVERQDGGSPGFCQSVVTGLFGGAGHSVLTEISGPPLVPLNVTPGSTTTLVELDFVCNTAGNYKLTLTAVPDTPFGSVYVDVNLNTVLLKTVPHDFDGDTVANQVADTITINCSPDTPTPGPSPTPTPSPTPIPTPCPITPSGSPFPGMTLAAPATVLVGVPFTLCVSTSPAPNVAISGFATEVLFPNELEWVQRPACTGSSGEVQVGRQDGGPLAFCLSQVTALLGGAGHTVLTEIAAPPLEPLNVAPGSNTTLVELDFVCNTSGSYELTLTAVPDSTFGSVYVDVNSIPIFVKTVSQDYDGDTVPNQVADTIAINCSPDTPTPSPAPTPTAGPTPPSPCLQSGNDAFEAGLANTNVIPCWTVLNQAGSFPGGWCNQTGTLPPQGACSGSSTSVAAPPEGIQAAMTNQNGPGSHVLYRCDILASGLLSFQLYINNENSVFLSPPSLDFTVSPNQQLRADLVTKAGITVNPFTVAPGDILLNIYQTQPGDALVSGYNTVTADVSAYVGENVCLRFAQVETEFFFHTGVDNVQFETTPVAVGGFQIALGPPASSSTNAGVLTAIVAATAALALGGTAWYARRRARKRSRG